MKLSFKTSYSSCNSAYTLGQPFIGRTYRVDIQINEETPLCQDYDHPTCIPAGLTPLTARQLTLEQALQSATASSLTAHNAKLTLEKQLNQASINAHLPSISISAGATASTSLLEQNSSAQISPAASLSFSLSSTDRYAKASNALLAKTAQTTYSSSLQSLGMQVMRAYWNVAAAQLSYEQQKRRGNSHRLRLRRCKQNTKEEGPAALQ
jgi:hypothetical protein